MARIHPGEPDSDSTASEKVVFQRLRDGLPGDWTVLHARRFLLPGDGKRKPVEGEVDFLVLDPDRGFLGLEVKGGGVGRDSDGWFRTDPSGRVNRTKDPGKQAQDAVHAIRRYLASRAGFDASNRKMASGWGVVLPFLDVTGSMGPELPRELIIDKGDLRDIRSAIERILRAQGVLGPPLSASSQKAFLSALAPTVHLVSSLGARIDDESAALVRLTNEQMEILETLREFPRIAVRGGAGTGKTLVAMERSASLAREGKRVLFLCYNRPLADFLGARAEGFTVKNFHSFCRELTRSAGIPFEVPKDPADESEFWDSIAPEKLNAALDLYPDERWDAVVIDEGQDFREYWWLAVEKLLRRPEADVLWVFYDPNQDIYGGGPTEALGLRAAPLRWNCRNTAHIASYASDLVGAETKLKPGTPEGAEVEVIRCADDREMIDAVRKSLHRLVIEERLSGDRIVVLSPRGTKGSPVWRERKLGNITLEEWPKRPGPNQASFTSLQRFKGLESDAIILCDVEAEKPMCSPKHLYVGSSRARHILVVAEYSRN